MSVPGVLGGLRSQPGNLMPGYGPSLGDLIQASAGLVSHWPLNEGSGTIGHDYKAAHDAALHGSPTFNVASAPGQFCLTLNSGDYITTAGTINTATVGVECWFRLAAFPSSGNGLIAGFYDSAAKTDKCLYVTSAGQLFWLVNDGSAKTISSGVALTLNHWYHAVGVADGSNSILYQNGVPAASTGAGATIASYANAGNFFIGGGPADTWVKLAGRYSEAAVFSTAPTAGSVLVRYNEGAGNIFDENARITQVVAEVLRDSSTRKGRVSQVVAEVLRDSSTRKARITQVVAEVLRSTSAGSTYSVAAANAVLFTSTGAGVKEHVVAVSGSSAILVSATPRRTRSAVAGAASSFTIHAGCSGIAGKTFSVSGSNGMLIHPATSETVLHNSWDVSAATSFGIGSNGFDPDNPLKFLAAANHLLVSATATAFKLAVASATSGWRFTYLGVAGRGLHLTASTSFLVHSASDGVSMGPRVVLASASTSFNFAPTPAKKGDFHYVNASHIRFTCTASAYVSPINVSAASGFKIGSAALELCVGPLFVSAASRFTLGQVASEVAPGPIIVSASTALLFSQSGSLQRLAILRLLGVTRLVISGGVAVNFDRSVSGHSTFIASSVPTSTRAIFVSASTSMSLTPTDKSNQFIRPAGVNSVIFAGLAGVLRTGTLAGNRVRFTDLAEASVWLPWRTTSLTRPPGGGLPHS